RAAHGRCREAPCRAAPTDRGGQYRRRGRAQPGCHGRGRLDSRYGTGGRRWRRSPGGSGTPCRDRPAQGALAHGRGARAVPAGAGAGSARAAGKDRVRPRMKSDSEAEIRTSLSDHIDQNIQSVAALHERSREALTRSQRRMERLGSFVGRPIYLIALISFVLLWVIANLFAARLGLKAWDPPPFSWLQGILTWIALLTSTVILIAQNRQTKIEQQRAHLDLQVNLLTEQKVTKLIHLLEELRRDLPNVRDRHDPQATSMQQPADADAVLAALENVGLTGEDQKS